MMFLYLPLFYMGDIPLVSFNVILDYSLKKKRRVVGLSNPIPPKNPGVGPKGTVECPYLCLNVKSLTCVLEAEPNEKSM